VTGVTANVKITTRTGIQLGSGGKDDSAFTYTAEVGAAPIRSTASLGHAGRLGIAGEPAIARFQTELTA
jgi:hypothetical protein